MLALWGALKSAVDTRHSNGERPKVLAVGGGIYGCGIGEMARSIGCDVEVFDFEFDCPLDATHAKQVAERIAAVRPTLVTAVHCETPSGTLNVLDGIGAAAHEVGALFYVDFVSSAGGAPLNVDALDIDLGLLGSQKVLGCPPTLSIVTVSPLAWQRIEQVKYVGCVLCGTR